MSRAFKYALLMMSLLAAQPLLAQSQRFLTGLYLQAGPGTFHPFHDIHIAYEVGGAGTYPITKQLTLDANLGYSHNGVAQGDFARVPNTNSYIINRVIMLDQARLELGLGIPDKGRIRWTLGGYGAVLLLARERQTRTSTRGNEFAKFVVTDLFRKYDLGLQFGMHGSLTARLQVDLKVRQGVMNVQKGFPGISRSSQAYLVGLSWYPAFAERR